MENPAEAEEQHSASSPRVSSDDRPHYVLHPCRAKVATRPKRTGTRTSCQVAERRISEESEEFESEENIELESEDDDEAENIYQGDEIPTDSSE